MHPEIDDVQSKLKEILYDCAVEIRATKAALYLFDQPSARYELITEYGFKGAVRPTADQNDPVVDRCGRGRTAFYINGLMAEPRFSEILYESATDRILVAPIHQRGQLVGFIDMRDKQAKQPFESSDLPKAQRIADRVAELFANKNVFGQRFIQLASTVEGEGALTGVFSAAAMPGAPPLGAPPLAPPPDPPVAKTATGPVPIVRPAGAAVASPPRGTATPAQTGRISRANAIVALARPSVEALLRAPTTETLIDADLPVIREMLRLMLFIPGAVAASFAAVGHLGGLQEISARSTMGDDAVEALQSRTYAWLKKRGETASLPKRTLHTPAGTAGAPVKAAEIVKVFTAEVAVRSMRGLYLSIAFAADPDRNAHDLLAMLHRQLQNAIEHSVQRRTSEWSRRRIAERLLEPDFQKYAELRRHDEAVVARVDAFARYIGLSPIEVENARLLAMVHDVGMRLLDYERLYRKRDLSHDELELLRHHPLVGAALVEPFLGIEIARAVLAHHERWDGGGYPNDLRGAAIPLLSRVLQICDVYETMIAPDGYQPQKTHDAAMAVINSGAGIQFDPDLAGHFVEMMRNAE